MPFQAETRSAVFLTLKQILIPFSPQHDRDRGAYRLVAEGDKVTYQRQPLSPFSCRRHTGGAPQQAVAVRLTNIIKVSLFL